MSERESQGTQQDEVEGHAKRFHRTDGEAQGENDAEGSEQESSEQDEVEGHAKRFHRAGGEGDADAGPRGKDGPAS